MDDEFNTSIEPMIIDVNENPEEAVGEIFKQNIVAAAYTITSTAKGGKRVIDDRGKEYVDMPSRLQYDAAKYVVEFILGKPREGTAAFDGDPWEKLRAEILADAKKVE